MNTLPEWKVAAVVELLRQHPMRLDELRRERFVRAKIGRGYLADLLTVLLDSGKVAVTDGVFWARQSVRFGRVGP